jgi:carbonic anhydrase/acetyltransferase-like protein (isoleucine patch superfamily)
MSPESIRFRPEQVHETVFIAPGAVVLGDVHLAADVSVWYQAVIRGDTAPIQIGRGSNIQDGAILHADPGFPCSLGERVTVGHGAIVHGATIGNEVLIGMRAVVMNGAQIGVGSIVGVGAVVPEGMVIPPGSVVMGIPAVVKRSVTERDQERIAHAAEHYISAGRVYRANRKK